MLQLKRNPEKVFWKCIGGYCSCSVISLQAVFKMYSTLNSVCTISQPCAMQCPVLRSLFLLGPVADNFLPSPTYEWMLRCCLSFFLQCNFTSIFTVAPQIHIVGTSWILHPEIYEPLKGCLGAVCPRVFPSVTHFWAPRALKPRGRQRMFGGCLSVCLTVSEHLLDCSFLLPSSHTRVTSSMSFNIILRSVAQV